MEEIFQIVGVLVFIAFSLFGSKKNKKKGATPPVVVSNKPVRSEQKSLSPDRPRGGLRALLEKVVAELSEVAEVAQTPKHPKKRKKKKEKPKVLEQVRPVVTTNPYKKEISESMRSNRVFSASSIREAIIMKEILDKPISLR